MTCNDHNPTNDAYRKWDDGIVPSITYPTHKAQTSRKTGQVNAICDCFSGRTLRCFKLRWEIGEIVNYGSVFPNPGAETADIEEAFCVVIGHSTWQSANAMKRHTKVAHLKLESGFWHEVISE